MHVRTLGRAELSANGTRLGPEAPVCFPLLLHLVLERDRWVSRVQLQEMLFPQQDRLHARHSLRQSVYTLRKEGFPIEGSGPAVHIPAQVIVDDYSALLTPQLEGERELSDLMGGWLAGFEPTISPAYSHWFEGKRSEIAHRMRTSLLAELAVHKRNARWAQCERTCRAILSLDPLNEEATLGLAEALALTGAKVQAIRILERYQEEMPNADLQLPARILRRRISEHLIPRIAPRVPPLVGREREAAAISAVLEAARRGDSSGVLLTGEPGLGKTRLLAEAEQLAVLAGFKTVSISCRPHDARRPLGVFIAAVPQLRALPGALGCSPDALRLLSRIDLVPGATEPPDLTSIDSTHVSAAVAWAIDELFESVATEAAILVTVDDIHWADEASIALLTTLLRNHRRRLAIVLAGRSRQQILEGRLSQSFAEISVSALNAVEARSLFRSEAQLSGPEEEAAANWVEQVGAGNPLYLVTLSRHLRENPLSRSIPTELSQLLESRLADLDANDAHVFAAVCALGRHATFSSLDRTLGVPSHAVMAALDRLDTHGFVTIVGDRLEATHPLLAEAALRRTSPTARSYLFHSAARALGADGDIKDPTTAWDIVHLLTRSGATQRAATVARKVARHALTIGRAPEACDLLQDIHGKLPISDERSNLEVDLVLACRVAGRWSEVRVIVESMLRSTPDSDLSTSELRFLSTEAQWHEEHKYEQLVPALVNFAGDVRLSPASRFRAADLLLIAAVNLNDLSLASTAMKTVNAEASPESDKHFLCASMIYEMSFGDMARAEGFARRLLSATSAEPLSMQTVRWLCNAADALAYAGHLDDALDALVAAFERTERFGFTSGACRCGNEIANFLLLAGRIEDARKWTSCVMARLDESPSAFDRTLLSELQFWIAVFDGDHSYAKRLAAQLYESSVGRSPRSLALSRAALGLCEARESRGTLGVNVLEGVLEGYYAHRGGLEAELWTWAVCEILRVSGRPSQAHVLARDYVEHARREGGPVRSALATYLVPESSESTAGDPHQAQGARFDG